MKYSLISPTKNSNKRRGEKEKKKQKQKIPLDLSKLSGVVKNDVIEKTVYDKLVAKVNIIDTNDFVLKTKYNTEKTELEKKILNVTDFINS